MFKTQYNRSKEDRKPEKMSPESKVEQHKHVPLRKLIRKYIDAGEDLESMLKLRYEQSIRTGSRSYDMAPDDKDDGYVPPTRIPGFDPADASQIVNKTIRRAEDGQRQKEDGAQNQESGTGGTSDGTSQRKASEESNQIVSEN